jgi:DMSO reductase anchor subunit
LVALTFVAAPVADMIAAIIAACAQGAGLLVERWLFFAEAKHVVGLYYGR